MRNLICDYLLWLSRRAEKHADGFSDPFWHYAWRRRSRLWADLQLLFDGIIGWPEFKRRRHNAKTAIQARWPT